MCYRYRSLVFHVFYSYFGTFVLAGIFNFPGSSRVDCTAYSVGSVNFGLTYQYSFSLTVCSNDICGLEKCQMKQSLIRSRDHVVRICKSKPSYQTPHWSLHEQQKLYTNIKIDQAVITYLLLFDKFASFKRIYYLINLLKLKLPQCEVYQFKNCTKCQFISLFSLRW